MNKKENKNENLAEKIRKFAIPEGEIRNIIEADDEMAAVYQVEGSHWSGRETSGVSYLQGTYVSDGNKNLEVKAYRRWRDGDDPKGDNSNLTCHVLSFVKKGDETYSLTLKTGAGLVEQIDVDLKNEQVEVKNRTDVRTLEKNQKLLDDISKLYEQDLNQATKDFGRILRDHFYDDNTKAPKVLSTAIDEERGLASIALGHHTTGYGGVLRNIALYVLHKKEDGELEYQKLNEYPVTIGSGSSWASSSFHTEGLKINLDNICFKARVCEWLMNPRTGQERVNSVDKIDISETIKHNYHGLKDLLEE